MKNERWKFTILHHVIYFRCFGPKGKSADQNRECLTEWNKKIRDPLTAVLRDLLRRRYESKFFRLQNNVGIWDPPFRQHNPAYTHHKDKNHHVNTEHKTESHYAREKPEEELLRSKRVVFLNHTILFLSLLFLSISNNHDILFFNITYYSNSCVWHICVTRQGIDYKLSEDDTIVTKHVVVW